MIQNMDHTHAVHPRRTCTPTLRVVCDGLYNLVFHLWQDGPLFFFLLFTTNLHKDTELRNIYRPTSYLHRWMLVPQDGSACVIIIPKIRSILQPSQCSHQNNSRPTWQIHDSSNNGRTLLPFYAIYFGCYQHLQPVPPPTFFHFMPPPSTGGGEGHPSP